MFKGNYVIILAGFIFLLFACHAKKNEQTQNESLSSNIHKVEAQDVMQATNYTYVQVKEGDKEYWIAINKADVQKGNTYYWSQGVVMRNFPSKELNRTFPLIFLVQDFSDKPVTADQPASSSSWGGKKSVPEQEGLNLKPADGGITIAELFKNRSSYVGRKVAIRGEVVKINDGIMGRNWVHIQDGTRDEGEYDLTVTTQDEVKVGDVAVFQGTITLNKDFGAGYFYDVIMEDATLQGTPQAGKSL